VGVGSKAPGLLESLRNAFATLRSLETLGKAVVDRLEKRYRISGAALILQAGRGSWRRAIPRIAHPVGARKRASG
jgi:hypothetical protein